MKNEENINNLSDFIEQLNSFANFNDFLKKLFRGDFTLTGIEKVKVVGELSRLRSLLKDNDISNLEKRIILIQIEITRLVVNDGIGDKKTIINMLADMHNHVIGLKLKEKINTIDPYTFERIVAELLRHMNYSDVETTKQTRDGGIDIIAYSKIGKSDRIKTVVQVKKTKSNIGTPIVDKLRGAMSSSDADRGLIITTSDFTKSCRKLVEQKNGLKVSLVSGDELIDFLIKHNIGVHSENFAVIKIDEAFFNLI